MGAIIDPVRPITCDPISVPTFYVDGIGPIRIMGQWFCTSFYKDITLVGGYAPVRNEEVRIFRRACDYVPNQLALMLEQQRISVRGILQ